MQSIIPVYKPFLPDECLQYPHDALDSQWVIWKGPYRKKATEWLGHYLNVQDILLMSNGTTACHFLSKAIKYKFPKIKKIIVPNNVYIACWNSLLFDKDYEIIPVDADVETWNFDINKVLNRVDKDIAILVVHNLGNIINIPALQRAVPNTPIIEDNCEGFCGEYEGSRSGTKSFASALSFCGNKMVTSGEGGAFICHDHDLYSYLESTHCQGDTDTLYLHDKLGYNYRMTNIQAALLYGQLLILNKIKLRKSKIFNTYRTHLREIDNVIMQKSPENTKNADWMMGIRILGNKGYQYVRSFFYDRGIDTRPMFYPISFHKHLSHINCDIKVAKTLSTECFMIPSFPSLTENETYHIIDVIKQYSKR